MKKIILIFSLLFVVGFNVAAQTTPVKVEGRVVCCADCWAEADRATVEYGKAEDLLKAESCVEGGDPTLIAVKENNKFTLYQLEQGKFKLTEKNWLGYVGKTIAVTGTRRKNKKANAFVVDSLEVIAPSIAEREAQDALGKTVELKLKDLFGTVQTVSQYKGRIVVLNFWATYCVPCRAEMPDLAAIQNEYAALGVQVIGASTDEAADRPKVLQFIKETKINFPVWMGATNADLTRFGLGEALPGTVVIDKNGAIVRVISGVVTVADLKKQIDSMLQTAESAVEKAEPIAINNAKKKAVKASSVPS